MSKLYGRISADTRTHDLTSRSHHNIKTSAETWTALVDVDLNESGDAMVRLRTKDGALIRVLYTGNIDADVNAHVAREIAALQDEPTGLLCNSCGAVVRPILAADPTEGFECANRCAGFDDAGFRVAELDRP